MYNNVSIGKEFYFKRDDVHVVAVVKNLKEFVQAIENLSEDVILFHLREDRNDFEAWVKYALDMPELAEELAKIDKTREPTEIKSAIISIVKRHM